jgi:hypothetical protein
MVLLVLGLLNLNDRIMTRDDFVWILIEAFAQDSPECFFKAQQKLKHKNEGYPKKGFAEGLTSAFKWLYHHVNRPDRLHYMINTAPGQVIEGVVNDENQIESLRKMGEVSFPEKNMLQVCRESDNATVLLLESSAMELLWPELFRFFYPLFEGEVPAAPMFTTDEAEAYGGITEAICIPDKIADYFPPFYQKPEESKSENVSIGNNPGHLPAIIQQEEIQKSKLPLVNDHKLNINQLALVLFYSGEIVTRSNCNEIVRQYGYESGEKLYQRFICYSNSCDRKARLETDLKTKKKIRLFESILPHLSKKGRAAAEQDIRQIRINMDAEY